MLHCFDFRQSFQQHLCFFFSSFIFFFLLSSRSGVVCSLSPITHFSLCDLGVLGGRWLVVGGCVDCFCLCWLRGCGCGGIRCGVCGVCVRACSRVVSPFSVMFGCVRGVEVGGCCVVRGGGVSCYVRSRPVCTFKTLPCVLSKLPHV